jgi:hypothetical protein
MTRMWLKRHDRMIKIAVTGIALTVAIVVVGIEVKAQRELDMLAAQYDANFESNKPLYVCLINAEAIATREETPTAEQVLAANEAVNECYRLYR